MPKWKDIAKLSDRDEKTREAAFEAQMLAMLTTEKPKPSTASSPPPTIAPRDAVRISVTKNGSKHQLNEVRCK